MVHHLGLVFFGEQIARGRCDLCFSRHVLIVLRLFSLTLVLHFAIMSALPTN